MPEIKEITEKLDKAVNAVELYQKKLDERDGKTSEQIEKIKEEALKNVEEIQKIQMKQEEEANILKDIEKQMSRVHTQGSESINEEDEKLKTQYMNYLRKGIQLHEDSVQLLAKKVCEKAYLSIDDETKVSKIREIRKSMIIGTDPTGGYFTIPDISSTRVTRNFETSPVRRVATIMSTLKKSMEFIIDDNEAASGGWVSEIQTRPTTATPDIGQLDIFTHEQFSQPLVTQDALDDDSFDIGTWLENKVQDIITRTENTAFVIGDGAGKPRGFLDYPAWTVNGTYQRGAVEQINSGINGDFTADSFVDLQNGLQEFYQSNAVWMIKRATFGNVMKLKDGQGQYLINPRILAEGAQMILLGNPVIFADDMPTIATDSLSVVYGDFRIGYTIVDGMGLRVLRDAFTQKPFIKFYTTKKVGGAVTNYESLKIMKLAV